MIRKLGTIISLLGIVGIVWVFTFRIEGEMGVVLFAFMIIAPLISLIIAFFGRKRLAIRIDSDGYVKKDNELEVTVTIEKMGKFPFSIIEIVPDASPVFDIERKSYKLSMLFADKCEFKYKVKAKVGGNGEVYIGNVYSCGFLGYIRFKVKQGLPEPVSVGVIPEIPDIKPTSRLLRQLADVVMTTDNDEENESSMVFSANTAPGYEHREYVQGDPLKRVNWKLSSKKDKLMVRLDEAVSSVQPMIILDLFRSTSIDVESSIYIEEKILMSVFGLLKILIKQGIACDISYSGGGDRIITETVDNPDYVDAVLLKVLAVKVVPGYRIDPSKIWGNVCACVIATTDVTGSFNDIAEKFHGTEQLSIIVPDITEKYVGNASLWYLDEDNNFKLV